MHDDDNYIPIGVYPVYGPYSDSKGGNRHWKVITKLAQKQSGKIVKRTTRAASQEEAEALRQTVVGLIKDGYESKAPTVTVGDLLDFWREREESRKLLTPSRRACIRGLERNICIHLPSLSMPLKRAVGRIKTNFEAWREAPSALSGLPKSPRTLKARYSLLAQFFGLAVRPKRWLEKNPMEAIERVTEKNPRPERRRLMVTEALTLWAYCRDLVERRALGKPNWPVGVQLALLLGTGLRIGELMDLQVRGLDRGRGGQVLRLFEGKTQNAARLVPLHQCPWLLAAIIELAQGKGPLDPIFAKGGLPQIAPARIREVLAQTGGHRGRAAKLLGLSREQMNRQLKRTQPLQAEAIKYGSQVGNVLRRTCRRLGVTVLSCHGLRRTFADLRDMVSDQALRDLAKAHARRQLGHAPGSSTMETAYLSPELRLDKETVDMGSVFAFLDSGGVATQEPPPVEEELLRLVERLGLERAKTTLEGISGLFPEAISRRP